MYWSIVDSEQAVHIHFVLLKTHNAVEHVHDLHVQYMLSTCYIYIYNLSYVHTCVHSLLHNIKTWLSFKVHKPKMSNNNFLYTVYYVYMHTWSDSQEIGPALWCETWGHHHWWTPWQRISAHESGSRNGEMWEMVAFPGEPKLFSHWVCIQCRPPAQ